MSVQFYELNESIFEFKCVDSTDLKAEAHRKWQSNDDKYPRQKHKQNSAEIIAVRTKQRPCNKS